MSFLRRQGRSGASRAVRHGLRWGSAEEIAVRHTRAMTSVGSASSGDTAPNAPGEGKVAEQRMPRPSWRLPLLGDVLRLDPQRPVQREAQFVQELGDVFEISILGRRVIVVGVATQPQRSLTKPGSRRQSSLR